MSDTNTAFHAWWASITLVNNEITEQVVLDAYVAARSAALEEASSLVYGLHERYVPKNFQDLPEADRKRFEAWLYAFRLAASDIRELKDK